MSAKKRSFLCKIVHKLTENARFFAQKPHFLHIFAGGRDDFLAGPKTGFLGVRGVARAAPPKTEFCFENSPDGSDGRIATLLLSFDEIK
jgi:hypothetical protein